MKKAALRQKTKFMIISYFKGEKIPRVSLSSTYEVIYCVSILSCFNQWAYSELIFKGLACVGLDEVRGLTSVRKGLEDLDVDESALANLNLDPVVHASDDLLSDLNGHEVLKGVAKSGFDGLLEGNSHMVLVLGEL